jgi:tetratricopeptide (TPR) repeat protein
MQSTFSKSAAILLLALPAIGGCRLPGREGPVPQSLADCRRLSQQGVTALERGDQNKSEALLSRAVAACPVDPEARRHYAESLWSRGAKQDAIAQMEEASHLLNEDASIWVRLAEMHLACGHSQLARQAADQALQIDSKLPGAWAIRGGVARASGDFREALNNDLRALSYAPNDRAILEEIAELHRQMNQPDRALQVLQSLADTYAPGEEPSHVLDLIGMAYVALGRYDNGAESFAMAVSRGQPSPDLLYRWGEAEWLAGHSDAASGVIRQALALQPEHAPSRKLSEQIKIAQRSQGIVR